MYITRSSESFNIFSSTMSLRVLSYAQPQDVYFGILMYMTDKKKVGVGFGVMIFRDNKILLGKRHDDPAKADSQLEGAGKWTMPGGKLDFGEKFEDGAKREVLEETGIQTGRLDVICVNQDIVEGAHFVTLGLYCEDFIGEPRALEPNEITEWAWFDTESLPSPMYFPSTKIIENYRQNKFYIAKPIINLDDNPEDVSYDG